MCCKNIRRVKSLKKYLSEQYHSYCIFSSWYFTSTQIFANVFLKYIFNNHNSITKGCSFFLKRKIYQWFGQLVILHVPKSPINFCFDTRRSTSHVTNVTSEPHNRPFKHMKRVTDVIKRRFYLHQIARKEVHWINHRTLHEYDSITLTYGSR